jgi:hypothetical protein
MLASERPQRVLPGHPEGRVQAQHQKQRKSLIIISGSIKFNHPFRETAPPICAAHFPQKVNLELKSFFFFFKFPGLGNETRGRIFSHVRPFYE